MRSVLALSLFAVVTSSIACIPERPDIDQEGLEAGECSDEADNDADGLYDCDDPDCYASPACPQSDVDPAPWGGTYEGSVEVYLAIFDSSMQYCAESHAELTVSEEGELSGEGSCDAGVQTLFIDLTYSGSVSESGMVLMGEVSLVLPVPDGNGSLMQRQVVLSMDGQVGEDEIQVQWEGEYGDAGYWTSGSTLGYAP